MNDRSDILLYVRNKIKNIKSFTSVSIQEHFQNETLRPILKFQNSLFINIFKDYINRRKGLFYTLNNTEKLNYIENALIKDHKFNNLIKGVIIGHFTINEYKSYQSNISDLKKRITTMVIKRLKDQIHLFENNLC